MDRRRWGEGCCSGLVGEEAIRQCDLWSGIWKGDECLEHTGLFHLNKEIFLHPLCSVLWDSCASCGSFFIISLSFFLSSILLLCCPSSVVGVSPPSSLHIVHFLFSATEGDCKKKMRLKMEGQYE